ncbi:ribonuclease H-like domain-containing protein [Tanacetum coccineum]
MVSEHQPIRSRLISRETLPDVKDAFSIISKEESHKGIASSSGSVPKSQTTSFMSRVNFSNNTNNGNKWFNNTRVNNSRNNSVNTSGNIRRPNLKLTCKDRGANHHMSVCTKNMFGIINISDLNLTIDHPNGTLAKIKYVGMQLSEYVVLYDVLVVPEYCINLLSMHKLIRDSAMFVGFDEHKCYIWDLNQNKVIGTGSESGSLNLFDLPATQNKGTYMSNNITCYDSKSLWYNKLGHPSDQVIDVLQEELQVSKQSHVDLIRSPAENVLDNFLLLWMIIQEDLLNEVSKSFLKNNQVDHLNFFDEKDNQTFKRPNDEERVSPYDDGSVHCSHASEDDSATSMGDKNTFSEGNVGRNLTNSRSESIFFDLNSHVVSNENRNGEKQPQTNIRRSSRPTKMPANFNDYVVNSRHKCLISLAICNGCAMFQLDANNAFLYGDLALRQWNAKLSQALVKNGFKQSKFDYSLYTKSCGNVFIALLVYVDDIVITENDVNEIEKFKSFLRS